MRFPKRRHREFKSRVRKFRAEFSQFVLEESNSEVLCGPMKGFRFIEESFWGQHSDTAAKIFGLYEQQNLKIIEQQNRPVFVDMGAADGFWGVGLVSSGKFEKSICFEISKKGQRIIRETAIHNGVDDKVSVFGDAFQKTIENISSISNAPEDMFFLIDIEGLEFDLLTEDFLTHFRKSELLIELHPQMAAEGHDKLEKLERFCATLFDVNHISGSVRDTSEMDQIITLGDDFKWPIISEGRGFPMTWLHLVPK